MTYIRGGSLLKRNKCEIAHTEKTTPYLVILYKGGEKSVVYNKFYEKISENASADLISIAKQRNLLFWAFGDPEVIKEYYNPPQEWIGDDIPTWFIDHGRSWNDCTIHIVNPLILSSEMRHTGR